MTQTHVTSPYNIVMNDFSLKQKAWVYFVDSNIAKIEMWRWEGWGQDLSSQLIMEGVSRNS